jgi:hypothetical protein
MPSTAKEIALRVVQEPLVCAHAGTKHARFQIPTEELNCVLQEQNQTPLTNKTNHSMWAHRANPPRRRRWHNFLDIEGG